jgi:hypothetical protein
MAAAAKAAKAAESRADDIEDAGRDPEDLLDEGIALSVSALTLISPTP